MQEEVSAFDLPEETPSEIIDKIEALVWQLRCYWRDPRGECQRILVLCLKLKKLQ